MSQQMILPGLPSAIFSRASEHGHTPCAAQGGRMTVPSGQDHVPASLSARQAKEKGLLTRGTCGPPSSVSSVSAVLTRFLASRLQALTALHGSTLYRLTWKQRTTPAGRSIPALRASAPRTSGSGCTGWPTPCGQDGPHGGPAQGTDRLPGAAQMSGWPTPTENSYTGAGSRNREGGLNLQTAVELSGWPTPRSVETGHSTGNPARAFNSKSRLEDIVFLTGWVTPSARDWKDTPGMATERPDGRNRTDQLPRQAATAYPCRLTVSGEMLTGFCAGMESGGQLNPALARWLMGLPPEWDDCAAMVTPLSRRRQPRS